MSVTNYDQWLDQKHGQDELDAIGDRRFAREHIDAIVNHCIEYFAVSFAGSKENGIDRFDGFDFGAGLLEYPGLIRVKKNLEKDRRASGYTNQLGPHEKAFIIFRAAGLHHFQQSTKRKPTNFLYKIIDPLPNYHPEFAVPEQWFDDFVPPVVKRRGRIRETGDCDKLQDEIESVNGRLTSLRADKGVLDADTAFMAKLKRYQKIQNDMESQKKAREVLKRKLRRWRK